MLSETASLGLQAISFFLLVVSLCALWVQGIWNALATDFPGRRPLSYKKTLGLLGLWGLIFTLVVVMISGTGELKAPGYSKKEGLFPWRTAPPVPLKVPLIDIDWVRRDRLERLFSLLSNDAKAHDGEFPPDESSSTIPADAWRLPQPTELRYIYVPGRRLGQGGSILAYEPGVYGPLRQVLLADGKIRLMRSPDLRGSLQAEAR